MCEFCAGHGGAAPGAVVGRKWQGGEAGIPSRGRHLRRCSRDPWDLFAQTWTARASYLSNGLCNRAGNMLFSWCFRACLVEGFAVD